MKDPVIDIFKPAVLIFLAFSGLLLIAVSFMFDPETSRGADDSSRFEIVSKYKNCDVVRYRPENAGTYVYFLHCGL